MKTGLFHHLAALLLIATGAFAADAPAATPAPAAPATPTFTYRVIGLFAPFREADLRAAFERDIPEVKIVAIDYEHAEATFAFNPYTFCKEYKPPEYYKRLADRVKPATRNTFDILPVLATPKEELQRIEIPVVGLDCRGCSLAAYESICRLDGVAQATASFHDGLITALIDPKKTNQAALESSLTKRRVALKSVVDAAAAAAASAPALTPSAPAPAPVPKP